MKIAVLNCTNEDTYWRDLLKQRVTKINTMSNNCIKLSKLPLLNKGFCGAGISSLIIDPMKSHIVGVDKNQKVKFCIEIQFIGAEKELIITAGQKTVTINIA